VAGFEVTTEADVEREHGRVHKLNEVARQLSISRTNAEKYGHKLGVLIRIRNGILPTYVVKDEDVSRIWEAKQIALKQWTQDNRDRAARAGHIAGRKRQHRDLMKQERNYFGRVQIFVIMRTPVEDPALSSETGPQMETLQYHPVYPPTEHQPELDTSVWNKTSFWNHESLDAMTTVQKRRMGLI
jgi:hypothetical protein